MSDQAQSPAASPSEQLGDGESRAVAEALVRQLLRQLAPEELADLPIVFETVYRAAENRLDESEERRDRAEGLPFDTSFLLGTALSNAVWILCCLLRGRRLGVSPAQRSSLHRSLASNQVDQATVRDLDAKIDVLIPALERLRQELVKGEPEVRQQLEATERRAPSDRSSKAGSPPGAEFYLLVASQDPIGELYCLGYQLLGREADGRQIYLSCPPLLLRRQPGPYIAEILTDAIVADPATFEELGTFLGEGLLPTELVEQLRPHVATGAVLQIISKEPGLPWEILRLASRSDGIDQSAPYLGDSFSLAQWTASSSPHLRLKAQRIAVIGAESFGTLPAVEKEVEFLLGLAKNRQVFCVPARRETVLEILSSGEVDVVHFAGHGWARNENPDRWSLALDAGESLTPVDLVRTRHGLKRRPCLVVLNACHSAREGTSLTGLGGVAAGFLDAGAAAVLGARWAVEDHVALRFVMSFYPLFLAGTSLAEAVRRARCSLASETSEAGRLAYALLAHPLAFCEVE